MKVVHVSHEDHGGAGAAAYRLHAGLRSLGVDSVLLTAARKREDEHVRLVPARRAAAEKRSGCLCNPEFEDALTAWRRLVERYPDRTRGLEMFSSPECALPLMEETVPEDADIIHLHWVCGMIPFDEPCGWLRRRPLVWTLHDMNPFTGGCHFSFGCQKFSGQCGDCFQLGNVGENDHSRRIHLQKQRGYAGLALTCVSPSAWMRAHASRSSLLRDMRHETIFNGIDLDLFCPRPKARRQDGRFAKDDFVVLFGSATGIGRKGAAHLAEALETIAADKAPHRVRLARFGSAPPKLLNAPKMAATDLTDLGFIEDETKMAEVFAMADLFVLPSLEDNLPNSVSEALACGTPVAAFTAGGIPEQVEHGVTGYLARPKDSRDLAQGIRWAMNRHADPEKRAETARACRTAAARFDQTDRARDTLALYRSVLSSNTTTTHRGTSPCSSI